MKRHILLAACVGFGLASCNCAPTQAVTIESIRSPAAIPLTGRVTDAAGVLTAEQRMALTTKLARLEQATKHQMVVATVSSLGGRDIKPFTTDLFNAWGIGRREYNDGVVVLIAPNQRQARITVGYGLEKILTNAICADIMRDDMVPRFKEGDVYGAIDAAVDALAAKLT